MVGLLIVAHDQIGTALIEAATTMLGMCPIMVEVLSIAPDCDPDVSLHKAREMVASLDKGAGVLVLTDIYGSTPSNIAANLAVDNRVIIVSGVNLPMLVRVMNYPSLNLVDLAQKAETGGRDGIFSVQGGT